MLYYDRINISVATDPTKKNRSKEFIIFCYCFFNHGFKFQDFLCNGCHDLTMLSAKIINNAGITIKNIDYCCIIHNISKSETFNSLKNSVPEVRGYM